MKVLWLTSSPAGASNLVNQTNPGRGWIASLGNVVKDLSNIELAVAFFNNQESEFKFDHDGIRYYPMQDRLTTFVKSLKSRWRVSLWDTNVEGILKVVNDFKPDIIQVFGTESGMGEIVGKTKIPVIVHLQGLINSVIFNWLPKGISYKSIFFKSSIKDVVLRRDLLTELDFFKKMAIREEKIIKSNKYFFGRTEWDRGIVRFFNPGMEYFHCNEVLRPFIYDNQGKWRQKKTNVLRLVTIINPEIYKGLDTVLETAQILKEKTELNFEWNIIGVTKNNRILKMMEKNKTLRFKNYPINFLGVKQGDDLIAELLSGNLFIHPSHVDNSPNSICEAMLLGMPVIASYVGGIPSLIENNFNGWLYSTNDSLGLASIIIEKAKDTNELERISKNAVSTAMKRHDISTIAATIEKTYSYIISQNSIS